jgi:MinD superfamily P-loop ATPase
MDGIARFSAGNSCPVVATVSKADYVIMVTDRPLRGHDLKSRLNCKELGKNHGIIINKAAWTISVVL